MNYLWTKREPVLSEQLNESDWAIKQQTIPVSALCHLSECDGKLLISLFCRVVTAVGQSMFFLEATVEYTKTVALLMAM